ncbi:MAG: DUF5711 family protein [Gudongella sp.]|nr:DUF5711 family protein [Gudongella sp.]
MKNFKLIVTTIIILFFIIIALFFAREENQKKLVNYIYSFDKSEKVFEIVKSYENEGIQYLNGRFLEWDGETLKVSDSTKKELWTKTFLFDNPKMVLNENRIVIYDELSGVVYLYNGNGETLLEHDFEKPIFNIKVWDQGLIAHLKLEDEEKILYYNLERDKWEEVSFIDSFPLDYWINNSNNMMYTQMKFEQNQLFSELFEKLEENTEIRADLQDEIILKTLPFKQGYIILTDMGIVKVSKGNENITRDYDLVHDILIDGEEIYILYGDNLEILDRSLETIYKNTYALSYTKLHRHEKYILLYGDKSIIALFNKEDRAEYTFGSGVKDIRSQFNDLIVTLKTGVYTMRIENIEPEKMEE